MGENALKDIPGEHVAYVHTKKVEEVESPKYLPLLVVDGEIEVTQLLLVFAYQPAGPI